jgi:5-(carboxyamino)imidazole ribonucleotide mutase
MISVSPLVGIIMGSQSDWRTVRPAAQLLEDLAIPHEVRIVSAHRTPDRLYAYAKGAAERGLKVIIAGAGGAAHLPGMASLFSIVQMPGGVPVATFAIGEPGARNAALHAAAILALSDPGVAERLAAWRRRQSEAVPEQPADNPPK